MSSGLPGERVEELLRARLRMAETNWRASRDREEADHQVVDDLGWLHPDGSFSAHRSAAQFNTALKAYREALEDWNRFILDRKFPDWLRGSE